MIKAHAQLPPGLHAPALGNSQQWRYATGDVLFQEGDVSDGLYPEIRAPQGVCH